MRPSLSNEINGVQMSIGSIPSIVYNAFGAACRWNAARHIAHKQALAIASNHYPTCPSGKASVPAPTGSDSLVAAAKESGVVRVAEEKRDEPKMTPGCFSSKSLLMSYQECRNILEALNKSFDPSIVMQEVLTHGREEERLEYIQLLHAVRQAALPFEEEARRLRFLVHGEAEPFQKVAKELKEFYSEYNVDKLTARNRGSTPLDAEETKYDPETVQKQQKYLAGLLTQYTEAARHFYAAVTDYESEHDIKETIDPDSLTKEFEALAVFVDPKRYTSQRLLSDPRTEPKFIDLLEQLRLQAIDSQGVVAKVLDDPATPLDTGCKEKMEEALRAFTVNLSNTVADVGREKDTELSEKLEFIEHLILQTDQLLGALPYSIKKQCQSCSVTLEQVRDLRESRVLMLQFLFEAQPERRTEYLSLIGRLRDNSKSAREFAEELEKRKEKAVAVLRSEAFKTFGLANALEPFKFKELPGLETSSASILVQEEVHLSVTSANMDHADLFENERSYTSTEPLYPGKSIKTSSSDTTVDTALSLLTLFKSFDSLDGPHYDWGIDELVNNRETLNTLELVLSGQIYIPNDSDDDSGIRTVISELVTAANTVQLEQDRVKENRDRFLREIALLVLASASGWVLYTGRGPALLRGAYRLGCEGISLAHQGVTLGWQRAAYILKDIPFPEITIPSSTMLDSVTRSIGVRSAPYVAQLTHAVAVTAKTIEGNVAYQSMAAYILMMLLRSETGMQGVQIGTGLSLLFYAGNALALNGLIGFQLGGYGQAVTAVQELFRSEIGVAFLMGAKLAFHIPESFEKVVNKKWHVQKALEEFMGTYSLTNDERAQELDIENLQLRDALERDEETIRELKEAVQELNEENNRLTKRLSARARESSGGQSPLVSLQKVYGGEDGITPHVLNRASLGGGN